jgi:hypothetical protein
MSSLSEHVARHERETNTAAAAQQQPTEETPA